MILVKIMEPASTLTGPITVTAPVVGRTRTAKTVGFGVNLVLYKNQTAYKQVYLFHNRSPEFTFRFR